MEPNTKPGERTSNIKKLADEINSDENPDELFDVFAALVRALPATIKEHRKGAAA